MQGGKIMEYRKDKRTKNLTLRDIHVGDWVQVWSEQAERYSPPLKITQICDDGTIYLVTSDEERCTPWEEDIKNVDALPITRELLEGFGFEITTKCMEGEFYVLWDGHKICDFHEFRDINVIETTWCYYEYFHEFMVYMYDMFPLTLKLEWKGIEK